MSSTSKLKYRDTFLYSPAGQSRLFMFIAKFRDYNLIRQFKQCLLIGIALVAIGNIQSSIAAQPVSMTATYLTTLTAESGVSSMAWSQGGDYLALALNNGQVTIFESHDWQPIYTINCNASDFSAINDVLDWSPNHLTLVIGCDEKEGMIRVTDLGSGIKAVQFPTRAWAVAWSPDGNQLAVSQPDTTIAILDTSFQVLYTIREPVPLSQSPVAYISRLAWSPTGEHLAIEESYQSSTVDVWDLANRQFLAHFGDRIYPIWSPDGTSLSVIGYSHDRWAIPSLERVGIPQQLGDVRSGYDDQYYFVCQDDNLTLVDAHTVQQTFLTLQTGGGLSCNGDFALANNNLLAFLVVEHGPAQTVEIWGLGSEWQATPKPAN